MNRRVAIIGGGWAGCAAAVKLAERGWQVTLLEAARVPGGRARRVELQGKALDNGQHILLGAYTESLRLMRKIGIDLDEAMLKLPLQMRYPEGVDGMDFVAARLPAPFHLLAALLRARGLGREDKLAMARFSTTVRWMGWRLHADCTVAELMERYDQTERLVRLLWRPLCIAALNTPPERASAQIFLNVLRGSLGARRHASDMLIPRFDLSRLFPERAREFVELRGGRFLLGKQVKKIVRDDACWRVDCDAASSTWAKATSFDAVVLAVQASAAAALLETLPLQPALPALRYEPIITCYLQYQAEISLPHAFFALPDRPENGEWGQFVFDRGRVDAGLPGLLAVVVSAAEHASAVDHDMLANAVALQLAASFGMPQLAQPIWTKVIAEKRATFSCEPGLQRPPNATALPGLFIAGDYTQSEYPATLESAVRSGVLAAQGVAGTGN